MTNCSDFPSDAMLCIKEVEMVDSLDESSRSVCGNGFPNFEMLDAKIASVLDKTIQNSQFEKKICLKEQKAQKEDRFLRGRLIAFMIYDYSRVTGVHDTVLDYADLFSVALHDDNILELDTRWDEFLWSMSKIPSDDILESLYKSRIHESAQLKTRDGIARRGDSSEDIGSQLSKVENHGEEEYRSQTSITKLRRYVGELNQEPWSRVVRD